MIFDQFSSDFYMILRGHLRFRWRRLSLPVIASLLLLVVMGSRNGLIRAQQPPQPLTLEISGDYWVSAAVQSPLIRRTNWGYNKEAILSPNGKLLASKSST